MEEANFRRLRDATCTRQLAPGTRLRERRAFREGDSDAIVRLSGDFHVLLTDIAANSALKRYLEDIIARESLIIQLYKKPGYHDCSADKHALI